MTIYFDMDGTIADLYSTKDWLPRLRAYDAKVYAEARPLCNMNTLARKLNRVQRKGVKIGVISTIVDPWFRSFYHDDRRYPR